jgi:hypothetical protein
VLGVCIHVVLVAVEALAVLLEPQIPEDGGGISRMSWSSFTTRTLLISPGSRSHASADNFSSASARDGPAGATMGYGKRLLPYLTIIDDLRQFRINDRPLRQRSQSNENKTNLGGNPL